MRRIARNQRIAQTEEQFCREDLPQRVQAPGEPDDRMVLYHYLGKVLEALCRSHLGGRNELRLQFRLVVDSRMDYSYILSLSDILRELDEELDDADNRRSLSSLSSFSVASIMTV